MKIIVGLGNPGVQYERTRHNIGFLFLDWLRQKFAFAEMQEKSKFKALVAEMIVAGEKVVLVKPLTFMNLSGETLVALKSFYKCEDSDFVVCFDDVDLPFGEVRLRQSGSAGTHNGMRSIIGLLGTEEIPRLKFGIDSDLRRSDLSSFVLGRFTEEEQAELPKLFENALAKLVFLT